MDDSTNALASVGQSANVNDVIHHGVLVMNDTGDDGVTDAQRRIGDA